MPLRRMRRSTLSVFAVVLAVAGVFAFAAVDPSLLRESWAQAQDTESITAIQTPPPVPGLTYPDETAGSADLTEPALVPATPVAPELAADSAGNSGLVDTGGGLTTNLGGSDVSVASEGGSYEVDGPKRKANRFPAPTPKP